MSSCRTETAIRVAPFLRWAGGKRWLASRISGIIGNLDYRNYFEPFLGGGSIFFGLNPAGTSYLSDLNGELVETYLQVRDSPGAVSAALAKHRNTADYYYKLRDIEFDDPVERAARFIFLNHTSFNGLHRVNLSGKYNVPFGNRQNPRIPDVEHLTMVSRRLKGSVLTDGDFTCTALSAKKRDLVFLDPPYTVAHSNNGFVEYNKRLFSFDDQERLAVLIERLRSKGVYFIMTNAFHESIADLFGDKDRRLVLTRANSIGGMLARRGSAAEYLFTNVPNNG